MIDYKKIMTVLLILAIADSTYLVAVQLDSNIPLYCSTTGVFNCASVLTSVYSHIFGVPMSFLGLIWSILAVMVFFTIKNHDLKFLWIIAGAGGVVYSLTVMTLLWEVCEYCLALDILIVSFIVVFYMLPKTDTAARS